MKKQERVWLSSPHIGENELKYVQEAFRSNWVAPAGPDLKRFEDALSNYFDVDASAALSSGTAAIHLALIALGVEPGDEVLVQSLTFTASANPIVYQGATPVFIDSEELTWNMDPVVLREAIEDRISKGKKPKAIIPVHLYGMPAQMAEIENISSEYDIPIIEDAAEAAGSHYLGKKCGSFGRMAALSFNGNKIITTSGGGALLSNDWNFINHARFLSTQAKDQAAHYQHSEIGYNYRMSNISACIGVGQLEVLPDRVLQRRANYDFYKNELEHYEGFEFVSEPYGYYSNRWLSALLIHPEKTNGVTREHLRLALDAENIESRPLWKPLHTQPVYHNMPYYGSKRVAERLFDIGLCLPSGSNMTDDQRQRTVAIIKEVMDSHANKKAQPINQAESVERA